MPVTDGRLDAAVRKLGKPIEDDIDEDTGEHRLRVRLTEGAFGNLRRGAGEHVRFEVIQAPLEIPNMSDRSGTNGEPTTAEGAGSPEDHPDEWTRRAASTRGRRRAE